MKRPPLTLAEHQQLAATLQQTQELSNSILTVLNDRQGAKARYLDALLKMDNAIHAARIKMETLAYETKVDIGHTYFDGKLSVQ